MADAGFEQAPYDPHTADATTESEFLSVVKSRPRPAIAASTPKDKTISLFFRDISDLCTMHCKLQDKDGSILSY